MFTKYISSALLFLVFAQGTLAVVCGNPPLPACPPPCVPACTAPEYCCQSFAGSRCLAPNVICPKIGDAPSS